GRSDEALGDGDCWPAHPAMNPKRTRAMATAFMGFPSSAQSGGSAREGHTPCHRGRGAGCANPKTTAKARGHYSKTAPTSIGTLRQMPEGVEGLRLPASGNGMDRDGPRRNVIVESA